MLSICVVNGFWCGWWMVGESFVDYGDSICRRRRYRHCCCKCVSRLQRQCLGFGCPCMFRIYTKKEIYILKIETGKWNTETLNLNSIFHPFKVITHTHRTFALSCCAICLKHVNLIICLSVFRLYYSQGLVVKLNTFRIYILLWLNNIFFSKNIKDTNTQRPIIFWFHIVKLFWVKIKRHATWWTLKWWGGFCVCFCRHANKSHGSMFICRMFYHYVIFCWSYTHTTISMTESYKMFISS